MDTSILETLFAIAPDLMEKMELRMLVLERVAALAPIGRRALAQRLHLPEREVRAAADALLSAGCIVRHASGMELTQRGQTLMEAARAVSRSRRSLSSMEQVLSRRLGVEHVCVVRGDADKDAAVLAEAAQALAGQVRFLMQGAQVLAVSGGQLMRMTAEAMAPAAPMDMVVVPAQGGVNGPMAFQANAVAELMAARLGGSCRLIHVPEGLSAQAMEELTRAPQLREALELLRHADVLIYGVNSLAEHELPDRSGAAAEALGICLDAAGRIVGNRGSLAQRICETGRHVQAVLAAVGDGQAEAIISVCTRRRHRMLVTDEGAALRILELLRV